jgi:transcriptional regulator GlxA family with amidase domain
VSHQPLSVRVRQLKAIARNGAVLRECGFRATELARHLGLGPRQLERLFLDIFGQRPSR